MSDGTVLNPGSLGDTIVTETLPSGQKIQTVKLAHGLTDLAEDVQKGDPLPIEDRGTLAQWTLVELRLHSLLMAQAFSNNSDLNDLRETIFLEISSIV